MTVVTATALEYHAARSELPRDIAVVRAGIGMRRTGVSHFETAISCGLAGGLRTDLPTGTVVVPQRIGDSSGRAVQCDARWQQAFAQAARDLGVNVASGDLYTSKTIVTGSARAELAALGFAAVDMESGAIAAQRLGCVRVILDTPDRELAPQWQTPWRAMLSPAALSQLPFLAKNGPRCARLAAQVIARALDSLRVG